MQTPAQLQGTVAPATGGAVSRRQLIALAGGSAAAAAFVAACGGDSGAATETSRFGDGDVGILNYALTLEYVEAAFYAELVEGGLFSGSTKTELAKFGEEEEEHVSSLIKAVERLEGDPAAKPKTKFSLTNAKSALEMASRLESLGAAAYLGQLPAIESRPALATVLSIHTVEGRHAAGIAALLGKPPTPDGAFAKPATARAVLRSVEPLIVG
jgi:hypothetical protein